ncbi:restriction endonuclease subunit S [Marinomonas rhizomae]|uniref:restriction endonuclease subunit S n=1 Tax=Marinomonas rhizomae TaxID=491948 RepID=UPI002103CF2E|nr:restriction endonuclease subunit S [Marinomonas rhizomae]UTV97926.1 restriction endonuclease subunit S [Marinomonas rhizomae]
MSVDSQTTNSSPIENLITEHINIWSSAIKRKSSSGRGSSKKIELYGIKKLRELILELAVRGKLVPQDPNDEPASVLLERIAHEKAQLVKDGKIKKPKKLPDITEDEKTFELPKGWEWARLGDVCSFINGFAFKSNTFQDSGVGIVKIGDISFSGEITPETMSRVSNTVVADLDDSFKVEIDDLVIAMSGATTGKLGFNRTNEVFYLNQRVGKFIPYQIDLNYLYLPLTTKISENLAKSIGSAIPNLSTVQINEIIFALPPTEEQRRIVAKVDELTALYDQLEAQTESSLDAHQTLVTVLLDTLVNSQNAEELAENWTRISGNFDTLFTTEQSIDQFKQTILQLAVMGKLVPQDPNDEPASALLERIAAEKAELIKQGKIKKQKPLPPISEDEKPFELPEGWECERVGTFCLVGTGATPSRSNSAYWSSAQYNWVSSGETSKLYISDTNEKISELAVKETNVTVYPTGTLIVAMYGQGKTRGQVSELLHPAGTNQACAAIQLVEKDIFHKDYVKLFFLKSYNELREFAAGGAQPNLNVAKVANTIVPIPPLPEQHRIVAKVDQIMAICDQLKAQLSEAQTTQLNLADALVEQAL